MPARLLPVLVVVFLAVGGSHGRAAQVPTPADAVEKLVVAIEQALASGRVDGVTALAVADADASVRDFAEMAGAGASRVVVKERDRQPLDAGRQRVLLEVFLERGIEGNLATWRLDLRPSGNEWRIERTERLSLVTGLFRLSLNPARQFDVRNLVLTGIDLTIEMASGSAFVAETPEGPTAIVLVGRARVRFTPPDPAERTQLRILTGADALTADVDGAFIRVRPSEFAAKFREESLVPRPAVVAGDLRRATELFDEFIGRTLQIDLTDISRDRWSLVPSAGDLIVELRTRQFGGLTYARSGAEAEDVTMFDRRRRRNIAVYASPGKLASRGRFYDEDTLVDYDLLSYDVATTFAPERAWLDGTTTLRVRVRAAVLTTLTLKLAEPLTVRGVYAPGVGRLLHLRVVGQNSLLVSMPSAVMRGTEISLTVVYSGRLEPSNFEREAISIARGDVEQERQERQERQEVEIPLEPRYVYSNSSYWYPQAPFTDYALARLRLTVPQELDVVATGVPVGQATIAAPAGPGNPRPQRVFAFENDRPIRYLACVISRLSVVRTTTLPIRTSPAVAKPTTVAADDGALASEQSAVAEPKFAFVVKANARQIGRARTLADQAADILQFYATIVGEAPYPGFSLAVTENETPGGHSPAYFAMLNQVLPTSPVVWRNDPVNFENYPAFYVAHEVAHQWWGQAVGWKNYHEQWLSEGFAQYFAALYAERQLGRGVFESVLRQMRRSAIESSPQGPIYLGYRLGHIKNDRRVFRSLIYNKSAVVLHMLRRLIGDEAFYGGVQGFYREWRFRKAGSDDLRRAMETASGRDLNSFFEAWIYGSSIPRLRFGYDIGGSQAMLRFEHLDEPVPLPVEVTVSYASGDTEQLIVEVSERAIERSIALRGAVRRIEVNEDGGTLAEIETTRPRRATADR